MALRGPIVTMPGKLGDLLLSMPVVRQLSQAIGPALVVTSAMCRPAASLLLELPYVRGVVVLDESEYRVEHAHFGAQPWQMPILTSHPEDVVFHLGFRHFPVAGQLVTHLAGEPYGIKPAPGPWLPAVRVYPAGPVAAHATVGNAELLASMVQRAVGTPRSVRLIGTWKEVERAAEALRPFAFVDVFEVTSFLEIRQALDGCSSFVGVNSGPSIVAMGGGLPVVWPHRPGVEQERWAHEGCDVRTVDQGGVFRTLAMR